MTMILSVAFCYAVIGISSPKWTGIANIHGYRHPQRSIVDVDDSSNHIISFHHYHLVVVLLSVIRK